MFLAEILRSSVKVEQEPQGGHGNHAGQEMATDFAVSPVEHGVDPDLTGVLGDLELVFDLVSVQ